MKYSEIVILNDTYERICEYLKHSKKTRLFYFSSIQVLQNNNYGKSKKEGEEICLNLAKNFNNKLKSKGIILRSTEEGYKIKNMLRLSIGSAKDNLRFMTAVKSIFNK